MGTTNGKVPGRVKYTFAFGALGKDLIYGMMATFAMIYPDAAPIHKIS